MYYNNEISLFQVYLHKLPSLTIPGENILRSFNCIILDTSSKIYNSEIEPY